MNQNRFCYYDAQGMLICSTVEKFTQGTLGLGESHANPTAVQPFCTGDYCADKAYSWMSVPVYQEAPSLWIEQFKNASSAAGKSSSVSTTNSPTALNHRINL